MPKKTKNPSHTRDTRSKTDNRANNPIILPDEWDNEDSIDSWQKFDVKGNDERRYLRSNLNRSSNQACQTNRGQVGSITVLSKSIELATAADFEGCDWQYICHPATSHKILDPDVNKKTRTILSKLNIALESFLDDLDISTLQYPQWNAIEVRYPKTSALLRDILGLPEGGVFSDKFEMLGLGKISFTDLIKALIGMSIHVWVFQSLVLTFPAGHDSTLAMLETILYEKGLTQLKSNLLTDIRYECFQNQKNEFPVKAAMLAAEAGRILQPMVMRHTEDFDISAPNIGHTKNSWASWRAKSQDLFAECLDLKALLELDGDFFEYRWPTAGTDFGSEWMESSDSRQQLEGRRVSIALLPAIIAVDRDEVLFKAIVVLQ